MTIKNIAFYLLVFLGIVHVMFIIFSYKDVYLSKFNADYWKERYLHSQWVIPKSKTPIGDDGLYSYAGWQYINGTDPTLINGEMPPFGKYLIGLSILLFHNENIFALFTGILSLATFFCLNMVVFKNKILAILPVFIFSFEPLFYTQLKAPFLDLLYLSLLFLTFIFFLKENYLVSSLFLGLMMATKSPSSTFFLVVFTECIYILLTKQFTLFKKYLLSLSLVFIVFSFVYIDYFFHGHTLKQFLGVQKYIIIFYAIGAKGNFLSVWEMLIAGKWLTWWGQTLPVDEWRVTWPALLLLYIVYLGTVVYKKQVNTLALFGIWVIIYLLFLSIIPVWSRYLLLLLPFMYNLAIWVISKSISYLLQRR